VKYRICKNKNNKYKIQYRQPFCWVDVAQHKKGSLHTFPHLHDSLSEAKEEINTRRTIDELNNNDWQCQGEY